MAKKPKNNIPIPVRHSLLEKKLQIMKDNPYMPCSSISKDRAGMRVAHTHADKVFHKYYEASIAAKLSFSCVEMHERDTECGTHKGRLVRCRFMVRDLDSHEVDHFWGAGEGDNFVWSVLSAQTVAFKQGLLMYFFTSWPQPEEFIEIVKSHFEGSQGEELIRDLRNTLPDEIAKIMEDVGAYQAMYNHYGIKYDDGKNPF